MTLLPRTNFLHMNWGLRRRNDYACEINWFFQRSLWNESIACKLPLGILQWCTWIQNYCLSGVTQWNKRILPAFMFLDTFSGVFKKEYIFFLHLAFPAHVTVFSGARLWKRVPEWRFVKTQEFRFHVDGRKRIFEYKMSYILQPRST